MNKLCCLRRASTGGNHKTVYDIGDGFIQMVNLKFLNTMMLIIPLVSKVSCGNDFYYQLAYVRWACYLRFLLSSHCLLMVYYYKQMASRLLLFTLLVSIMISIPTPGHVLASTNG